MDADIIVIGSGPAGVSVAWPLVEAGLKVLMLDAASEVLPDASRSGSLADLRASPERWRTELGATGTIQSSGMSPKFATPLAKAVLSGFAESIGLEAEGFMATGSLASGGLSRIWGALATRYDAADLSAYPDRAGFATSYDRVAARIGIGVMDPAFMTEPARRVLARHTPSDGFVLTPAPNAVLASPRDGRLACNACGQCLHGCARGSIYHSASELPALGRHAHFRYQPGMRVLRLAEAPGGHAIETQAASGRHRFTAPRVVLAAGTVTTTSLALRRLGLTGRPVRLQSNPVGGMAFILPHLIGTALPERSFGLGQLFYGLDAGDGVQAAGVFYGADTLPLAAIADRLPFSRPTALRLTRALAPALLLSSCYLPGTLSDNDLTVADDGAAGRVTIRGRQGAATEQRVQAAFRRLGREARRRGAWPVPGGATILGPGADAHLGSTLPMGGAGPAATSEAGELRGAAGIFVADGAALPALSAKHPTLTIMANADRIGRHIAALTERPKAAVPAIA